MNERCLLCDPPAVDEALHRIEVWSDSLWRLTISLKTEVMGFAYLEPRRHVPHLEDLAGEEASTFGPVLATVSNALKEAADADLVYVYIFGGGVPHLHVHLAPHRPGDALNDQIIRGEFVETPLPGGATEYVSTEFPLVPENKVRDMARRVHRRLTESVTGVVADASDAGDRRQVHQSD